MKVLFLDIDGVLNNHNDRTFLPTCVKELNRVLAATDCKLVISSSWRYMILKGAMTCVGFSHLLSSHGAIAYNRVLDCLEADGPDKGEKRGRLIEEWLTHNWNAKPYVVVDDLDLEITKYGHPFVQTDGSVGLTTADADRLIAILNKVD